MDSLQIPPLKSGTETLTIQQRPHSLCFFIRHPFSRFFGLYRMVVHFCVLLSSILLAFCKRPTIYFVPLLLPVWLILLQVPSKTQYEIKVRDTGDLSILTSNGSIDTRYHGVQYMTYRPKQSANIVLTTVNGKQQALPIEVFQSLSIAERQNFVNHCNHIIGSSSLARQLNLRQNLIV